jgi:hypothetical protein
MRKQKKEKKPSQKESERKKNENVCYLNQPFVIWPPCEVSARKQ